MELIYYSHGFTLLFVSIFFIMLSSGIWFWWVWLFLILAPFSYTPVLYYRRPTPKPSEESLSLVERENVKSFYNNVIKF